MKQMTNLLYSTCIYSFTCTVTFSCPPRPVVVPTPPPQPITDSNEIPPPTTQDPQQPTVPQETTNSPNNDNGQTQTLPNSEVVATTGVVSGGANVGLVVGIVTVVIVLIAVTLIVTVVVIALIIHGNKRKSLSTSIPTDTNQAYGVTNQKDMDKICDEEDIYSYPEVVLDNEVQTKPNQAYATTISTEGNVAYYSTNIVVQENEAYYIMNTVMETNVAYASSNIANIATKTHHVYESEPEFI